MAPSPRRGSRKDANALPSMSSTFWAIMILASLLIAYCSQLAAGTCEIVTLDRDSSQPRRTIARQTARCACKKGQIAGTTRARPACVDARIIKTKQWCEMLPCLEGEGCDLLINKSGWTCTQPGGRIKTTTVLPCWLLGPSMPCSGAAGVSWNQLCLKQGTPGLSSSQRASVAPLLSKPCHGQTMLCVLL
ncbi:chemokine-like protein TAFA-5 isoform X1 [Cyrtonyx montezumae]|uniref:chemokine-like protein TAFA-5 isoform X1 n=1 Tax=Cyrtonyx montezumae TaxID=9017 RepID=UPI0032DAA82D